MGNPLTDKAILKNLRRIARYIVMLADHLELQMSQKGKNQNAIIDRMLKAESTVAAQSQQIIDLTAQADAQAKANADLTTERDTLKAQVEDAEDLAADARAAAVLAGNAGSGATPAQA